MSTYAEAITDLRARLDEKTPRFYSNTDLLTWIVQGCRDIARRSETLAEYATGIVAYPGVAEYPWPDDALRFHRVEYVPASTINPPDVYPLELATVYEMDQRWGSQPYQQSVYPAWCVVGRGTPGNPRESAGNKPTFMVYPVPSQSGIFRVWYWALPRLSPNTTDNMEVSAGWDDLPIYYAETIALRADKDPRWQESQTLYEQSLQHMIEMTRIQHDQSQTMTWANGAGGWGVFGSTGWVGGY